MAHGVVGENAVCTAGPTARIPECAFSDSSVGPWDFVFFCAVIYLFIYIYIHMVRAATPPPPPPTPLDPPSDPLGVVGGLGFKGLRFTD